MKALNILLFVVVGAGSIACSDPTKDDVCGACKDFNKSACELSYDACDDDADCDLGDLDDEWEKLCK
jgi:hypothetical protein